MLEVRGERRVSRGPRPEVDSLVATTVPETAAPALAIGRIRAFWLTAAPGRIGTVAVTAIYQSLGTKEEKRA